MLTECTTLSRCETNIHKVRWTSATAVIKEKSAMKCCKLQLTISTHKVRDKVKFSKRRFRSQQRESMQPDDQISRDFTLCWEIVTAVPGLRQNLRKILFGKENNRKPHGLLFVFTHIWRRAIDSDYNEIRSINLLLSTELKEMTCRILSSRSSFGNKSSPLIIDYGSANESRAFIWFQIK